jgi:hypothetical protein
MTTVVGRGPVSRTWSRRDDRAESRVVRSQWSPGLRRSMMRISCVSRWAGIAGQALLQVAAAVIGLDGGRWGRWPSAGYRPRRPGRSTCDRWGPGPWPGAHGQQGPEHGHDAIDGRSGGATVPARCCFVSDFLSGRAFVVQHQRTPSRPCGIAVAAMLLSCFATVRMHRRFGPEPPGSVTARLCRPLGVRPGSRAEAACGALGSPWRLFRLKRATCFSRLRPAGIGGYRTTVYGGVG